jgi:DNA-binding MarR family transcriptional regulator
LLLVYNYLVVQKQVGGGKLRGQFDVKKVLGLIYRYYDFLEKFLPVFREGVQEFPRYTLTQLVDLTGKDIAYLSKLTDKLKEVGLLEVAEEPRDRGGRPYKVCSLSSLGVRLLNKIEEAFKSAEAETRRVEIEPWKIAECLNIMEDNTWSMDVRYKFAYTLFTIVDSDPVQALSKNDELKRRFEEWIANPPPDDKVGERIRATINISMTRLVNDNAMREWVLSKLYPNMLKLLNHSDPKIQVWAIGMLTDVAANTELKTKVIDIFLNTLLDRRVEELEKGGVFMEMLVQLSTLIGFSSIDEKRSILAKLKMEAKKGERRQMAEYLLDRLMTSILG